jgi:large conductance mechanosensitive channel
MEESMLSEFRAFLVKTNALALAIGVIIGAALGTVVKSLVDDIIMPPVGLLLGGVDFATLRWVLREPVGGDPATEVAIRYGPFINTVIAFIIVVFVVWRLSKMLIREEPEAPAPELRTCPFCRELVPVEATRCRACTSNLGAASG